jgi:MFS family permease
LITDASFLAALGNPGSGFLGLIIALYNVGCLAGCVVAGIWGHSLGRKKMVIYGSVIMIIGGTMQASIYEAIQMIIGRIVSGVGTGMLGPKAMPTFQRAR